jgi:DNA-binding transcriptional ArsR family regulator
MDVGQALVTIGRALSCAARVRLLQLAGKAGISVGMGVALTGLSQPCVSYHMAVLVRAGLLERARYGPSYSYRWPLRRLVIGFTINDAVKGDLVRQ